ncbi:50S ribosomal protein L25/general stress protein Ctc [Gleimia hominis]|uniref:50S ribosomal protein L25/general stress protein Ctc n=1 Tax=Gleimia hominis TaxID=595468 RepID=UPI000C808B13|nr:50S ribosomal protein L25/general stress protein Ctc [Gleimia hominis]WIK64687.1 50S ribosomal protein L25/general stress protein Ctc [Gleimia hominis]
MATHITRLDGVARKEFGKGAARRARRAGMIPAVIYSNTVEPVHMDMNAHDVFLIVKDNENALVNVVCDGEEQLAIVKDIQRHPVRREIIHLDLLAVRRDEKVDVDVPLVFVGESAPNTILSQEHFTLLVHAPAIDIPESIEVSIEGLEEGAVLTIADVNFPTDVESDLEPDTVIGSIMIPEEEPEEEPEETEESAEAEEGSDDGEGDSEEE